MYGGSETGNSLKKSFHDQPREEDENRIEEDLFHDSPA
jgi:hypothetical protein